jgi:hypothetical protein
LRGAGFATGGLVLGYLTLVAGIAALRYFPGQMRVARAAADARALALGIEEFMKAEGRAPAPLPAEGADGEIDPAAALRGLFGVEDGKVRLRPPEDRVKDGVVVDPWGRAYRIAVDGDGNGKISLHGIAAPHSAIVWSAGENGLDERGGGDDVCSWQP